MEARLALVHEGLGGLAVVLGERGVQVGSPLQAAAALPELAMWWLKGPMALSRPPVKVALLREQLSYQGETMITSIAPPRPAGALRRAGLGTVGPAAARSARFLGAASVIGKYKLRARILAGLGPTAPPACSAAVVAAMAPFTADEAGRKS